MFLVGLPDTGNAWAGCVAPINLYSIFRRADPKKPLGSDERALTAYAELFQDRLSRNDSDGIWQLARPWQRHYRFANERFKAIEEAANGSNQGVGLEIVLEKYANIPPEAKLGKGPTGISASWIGKSGKFENLIIHSPGDIVAAIVGVASINIQQFLDDLVAKGPPPNYRGICSGTHVVPL
jgi:hypothetical protein